MTRTCIPPLVALAALAAAGSATPAAPRIEWVEREVWTVTARPLTAPTATDALELELSPDDGARGELAVPWPEAGDRTRLRLAARVGSPAAPGEPPALELEASIEPPGRRPIEARRRLQFDEHTTALFEVARDPVAGPLTLVIEAERRRENVLRPRPASGPPTRLLLEVHRVEAGQARPLERNQLHTLVGEPVAYSFRIGAPAGAGTAGETGNAGGPEAPEGLEVRLTPLGLHGETIELRIELSGTIPHAGTTHVVARTETWFASRGASSSFDVVFGDPPTGYRFVVTPDF